MFLAPFGFLGGPLGALWSGLGVLLECSWGSLGSFWVGLGCSGVVEIVTPLVRNRRFSFNVRGMSDLIQNRLKCMLVAPSGFLGGSLGALGSGLGVLLVPLGALWSPLASSWAPLGVVSWCLRAASGASWCLPAAPGASRRLPSAPGAFRLLLEPPGAFRLGLSTT